MSAWLAIANPAAGALRKLGPCRHWLGEIERRVASLQYTDAPGHARALARAGRDYEGIVAVGGDGTVMEIIEGMDRSRQRLAVIPAGRGNSLARELGARDVPRGLDALDGGVPVSIDLMDAELRFADGSTLNHLAASTIGLGYVSTVVQAADNRVRRGHLAYPLAVPFVRPKMMTVEMSIGTDSVGKHKVTGVAINNTSYMANYRAFPRAEIDDGLLDVLELDAGWLVQNLHNLSVLTKLYLYDPSIVSQTGRVALRMSRPSAVIVDGELQDDVGGVRVLCRPSALVCMRGRRA